MTPGSLFPAYTQIEYHSEFAPHSMILPNRTPVDVVGDAADFTLLNWNDDPANWQDMVEALVTSFLPAFPTTVTFDRATLWTKASVAAAPLFRGTVPLVAMVGTDATPGVYAAVQQTITYRDDAGGLFKLTFLDMASNDDFVKQLVAAEIAADTYYTLLHAATNAWSSRKDGRISSFVSGTRTLNEALRRAYRFT